MALSQQQSVQGSLKQGARRMSNGGGSIHHWRPNYSNEDIMDDLNMEYDAMLQDADDNMENQLDHAEFEMEEENIDE